MTARKVSSYRAKIVLSLVAEWMGQNGWAASHTCPEGRQLDQRWIAHVDDNTPCMDAIGSPAMTGPLAARQGLGPQLLMDWDWTGQPTPTVILEGGPEEWAIRCCQWVQQRLNDRRLPVFVEPYSAWALSIHPA